MAAAQAFPHGGGQLSGAVGECCTTSPYAAMMSAARHEHLMYSVSYRGRRSRAGGPAASCRCSQLEWRQGSSRGPVLRVEAKAYDAAAAGHAGWRWLGDANNSEEGQLLGMQAEAAAVSRGAVNEYNVKEEAEAEEAVVIGEEGARRLKLGLYFAAWWGLNVVFNVYNKKVLNVFPYPWLTSALSLAAGSLIMLASWATRIVDFPETDLHFWKALAPVAVAHTIGHVAATVSMAKVAVSFTHIIKSSEPAFSVLVSRFLLGDHFSSSVYLSLIPIIGGCGLAALTELNFNLTGFMGAMISNLAFVFRNIFSKKGMSSSSSGKASAVGGMNYYACLSMFSLALLTPFAFAVEGPKLWAAGWQSASQAIGPHFAWWVVAQSAFYHLYNQVSYMSLDEISPLSFSIGNTMKRVSVIVASIIIFHTPVRPINALGAAIAILGTFLYAQAK